MRRALLATILGTIVGCLAILFATGLATAAPRVLQSAIDRLPLLALPARTTPPADVPELQPFWEAWDYLQREFYDETAIDRQKLVQAALRGMVSSIGDPYTLYLDPRHHELSEAELRGTFQGIGVQVEMTDQQLRIVSPLAGSPGDRAGLRPGDLIIQVDGQPIGGLSLGDAIRLIRGARGSSVTLTIQRADQPAFEVSIVREEIRVQAVQGDVRPDGIGYIKVSMFPTGVGGQLRQTIERMRERAPIGWVLDLRGNPGGTLDGAISVTSQFLDDGVVLYEQRRDGDRQEIRRQGNRPAVSGPIAVLVDRGSASAAEIVAAALQENGRATLIGEQTFGKGLVQVVHRLSDGSALRLTVARWLTPSGHGIQAVGLTPQIAVGADSAEDVALAEAVAYVQAQHGVLGGTAAAAEVQSSLRPLTLPEGVPAGAHRPGPKETVALLAGEERLAAAAWGVA